MPAAAGKATGIKFRPDPGATLAEIIAAASFTSFPWRTATSECQDWVNLTLARAWPKAKLAFEQELPTRLEHEIKSALPGFVSDLVSIEVFELGDLPPKMCDIAAKEAPEALRLRMHFDLQAGIDFSLSVGPVKLGVQEMLVSGDLVVEMTPIIGELPVVGAVRLFFVDPPELSFDFTGAASVANLGLIKKAVRSGIGNVVASQLVTPNSVVILLADTEDEVTQRTVGYLQPPIGVLRVHPESAARLADSDWNLSPRETCDPYLTLKLGSQIKTSSTVMRTVNPVWPENEAHDFVVFSAEQLLGVEVHDEDWSTDDDYLGCLHPLIPTAAVASSGKDQKLFQKATRIQTGSIVTSGIGQGSLKLRSEWLLPSADRSALASGALVIANVGMLEMPKAIATSVQMRLKFGDLSVLSPLRYTRTGEVARQAEMAAQQVKDIIVRGRKMGLSPNTLAALTGKTVGVIKDIEVQSKVEPTPSGCGWLGTCCGSSASTAVEEVVPTPIEPQELIAGNSVSVSISALLSLVLPAGGFERGGDIELELLDTTKTALASTSFPIGDVPLRWPLLVGENKQYKLKGTHTAVVSVTFSVAGLASGSPPQE